MIGFRASIIYFKEDPYFLEVQEDSIYYYQDGMLIVDKESGLVVQCGQYNELVEEYPDIDIDEQFKGQLIMPGFIDCHTHYPQTEMICTFSTDLFSWLNTYTFPTEDQFKDLSYARKISQFYLNQLLKNGTTTALVMATIHPESVQALFEEATKLNMRIITGKTLMDRNAPEFLCDTPESAYSDSLNLIEKYHNKGRCLYSITPRFSPTSTREQLQAAGKLKLRYPDVYMHTHLSESIEQVEFAQSLYPENQSDIQIFEQSNLVDKKSVFAHCVMCPKSESDQLSRLQCGVAFCPTSNFCYGAGIFPYHEFVQKNVNFGIGSDVGGTTDFSLLKTLQDAYKVVMISQKDTKNRKPMSSFEGFYRATLGGCKALHLEDKLGKFEPGYEADFVVLDWFTNDIQKLRHETIEKRSGKAQRHLNSCKSDSQSDKFMLAQRLFGIMMMGDQHSIKATYISGKQCYLRKN
ncbi:guanine deaminase (macronuclear) [Tetrahymena thermophila SB210]|uniref:Guanine deaminase n=1 Tax=Tetrahymena thermophila (strain SB210) TaxID=312017 RepID=I7LXU8_TETTS|nr:guanine deaminase [Tetrahymena thermophila SB210]EAS06231.1 guanine deaminase [Tetrahymena thermophila SB210]|eukprot:XP_001026476.1 guanine deaminase [Tetrahymena thermophila SB210]